MAFSDVSCPGTNGHSGNFYFWWFGLIWLFIVMICILTAFHLQSAFQRSVFHRICLWYSEGVYVFYRQQRFNLCFEGELQFRLTHRITSSNTTFPEISKLSQRERQVEFLARETQRKEEKQGNNGTQSEIRISTLLSSSFLGEKYKHCTARNECIGSGSELSR